MELMAFEYFKSDIDYWKGPKKLLPAKKERASFDWEKHLNPKNDEFFKEGQYTPPAAFMELVRSPNDKNIKNWFALVEKKNQLSQRLTNNIQQYLKKNQMRPAEKSIVKNIATKLPQSSKDYSRFRFRLYFESSCPHCQRMMKTMHELQRRGHFVELKQIDKNSKISNPLPFPVTFATKKELEEKNINSWPVLFIGDLEKKTVYRLDGYRSTKEVLLAINRSTRRKL